MKWLLCVGALLALTGCGYHVGAQGTLLPKSAHTIAVLNFGNNTTRYRLTDRVPAAIARELIARTKYRVTADADQSDLVLRGGIINYTAFPNVLDQQTGRAVGVQVSAFLQISLVEKSTGKVLFDRPFLEFRQRYEIATDQVQYFDESETAQDRLSRDIARYVVSAILEAF